MNDFTGIKGGEIGNNWSYLNDVFDDGFTENECYPKVLDLGSRFFLHTDRGL